MVSVAWGVIQYELGLAAESRQGGDRRGNLLAAVDHYRKASTAFTLESQPDEYAMVWQNLGSALSDLTQLDPLNPDYSSQAIAAHRRALQAHAHRQNPVDWASGANNLAIAFRDAMHGSRADQLEEAIGLHEAALAVFTAGGVGMEEALQLRRPDNRHWSDALIRLAPFVRSSLQSGQETYTRVDFLKDRAWVLSDLAITLRARLRGDLARNVEAAIEANLEALGLYAELNDRRGQARVANNLARAYLARVLGAAYENWDSSARYYSMALDLHRRGGSTPFEIAQTEQNFGVALVELAERFPQLPRARRSAAIEDGIRLLRSALRVRTKTAYPYHWAMTSSMLGMAHLNRIEGEAEANLEDAIALFDELLNVSALRDGAPVKWLDVKAHQGKAYWLRIRGERRKNLETAVDCFATALRGFEAASLLDQDLEARLGLARALAALGRRAEAVELLRAGVEKIEVARAESEWTRSKRRWSVHLAPFIDELVQLSWAHAPGEALEWSEFGRGRALADVQASRRAPPMGVPEERFDEYRELQELREDLERRLSSDDRSAALLGRLHAVSTQVRALEAAFRKADPLWAPAVAPLKLQELMETATSCGIPVLVVRINPEGTYAWLLRPDGTLAARRFETPSRDRITRILIGTEEERAASWVGSYAGRDEAFDDWLVVMEERLAELWEVLTGKLHWFVEECGNPPQLVVIASQGLGLFPLHASWRVANGEKRFWCDDYAISYAPSVATLRAAHSKSSSGAVPSLLAVANPTDDLPWAEVEALQVSGSFVGQRTLLTNATRARVLAELARRPDVILFSCHGKWDFGSPWSGSGFELADSMLTLGDLGGVNLGRCRLAILNACETGMSDASDSADEFVGLPAAFIAAGTASVVGSLWSVDDVTTALIVARAFAGTGRPALCLHEAQKWIRQADLAQLTAAVNELHADPLLQAAAVADFAERGTHPCAHPFWWAALTCTGVP